MVNNDPKPIIAFHTIKKEENRNSWDKIRRWKTRHCIAWMNERRNPFIIAQKIRKIAVWTKNLPNMRALPLDPLPFFFFLLSWCRLHQIEWKHIFLYDIMHVDILQSKHIIIYVFFSLKPKQCRKNGHCSKINQSLLWWSIKTLPYLY